MPDSGRLALSRCGQPQTWPPQTWLPRCWSKPAASRLARHGGMVSLRCRNASSRAARLGGCAPTAAGRFALCALGDNALAWHHGMHASEWAEREAAAHPGCSWCTAAQCLPECQSVLPDESRNDPHLQLCVACSCCWLSQVSMAPWGPREAKPPLPAPMAARHTRCHTLACMRGGARHSQPACMRRGTALPAAAAMAPVTAAATGQDQ